MNPTQLLATLGERGATARAEIGDDGAAVLVVAPREAIGALLPDLKRLKPDLLELLTRPLNGAGVHRWREPEPPAPDVAELSAAISEARRGAWLTAQPRLLARWRELQTYTKSKITSQELGALMRLRDEQPEIGDGDLIALWLKSLDMD